MIKALQTSTEYLDFYNDLNIHLSVAYFIDGDFMEHFKIDSSNIRGYWFNNSVIYDSKGKILREGKTQGRLLNESLNTGEIVISTSMFEEMFGVNVSDFPLSALDGFTITISERYMIDTGYDNPYSKKTYKIV